MKTAVSIPDEVFDKAEKLARSLGQSRSQLYSQALNIYLEKHNRRLVTETLDRIYSKVSSDIDFSLQKMQIGSLSQDKW